MDIKIRMEYYDRIQIDQPKRSLYIPRQDQRICCIGSIPAWNVVWSITKDDNEEKRIPVFLFGGAEEWYRKEFGRSTEAGLKAEKQNVADALLSFMYGSFEDRRRYEAALNAITDEEKKKVFMEEWQDGRTSMKNIGEYAHQLGEKLKGKVKCCIDDTTKVDT